jgi:hypothetical protein
LRIGEKKLHLRRLVPEIRELSERAGMQYDAVAGCSATKIRKIL